MATTPTYYVAPDGADSNPGTLASPFRTVQAAAASARSGDLVLVRGGTYDERVVLDGAGGVRGVTYRAYPGEHPKVSQGFRVGQPGTVLDGFEVSSADIHEGQSNLVRSGIEIDASGVVVQNCSLHDLSDNSDRLSLNKYHAITVTGAQKGVEILGNKIVRSGYHGIYVPSQSATVHIAGNVIDHAGYDSAATSYGNSFGMGIWVCGTGCVVESNTVTYPWQDGIVNLGRDNLIRGNDVQAALPSSVSSVHKACIYDEAGAYNTLYEGNIFRESGGCALEFDHVTSDTAPYLARVQNNVFVGPVTYLGAIMLKSDRLATAKSVYICNNTFLSAAMYNSVPSAWQRGSIHVFNNIFAGGASMIGAASGTFDHGFNLYRSSAAYPDAGGIGASEKTGDPRFVGVGVGDYRLQAGSPAIDAADGDAAPATDRVGASRIDDPAVSNSGAGVPVFADIGAYEYVPPGASASRTSALPDPKIGGMLVRSTNRFRAGGRQTVSGSWYDERPTQVWFEVTRRAAGGRWRRYATVKARCSSRTLRSGSFSAVLRLRRRGRYRVVVRATYGTAHAPLSASAFFRLR